MATTTQLPAGIRAARLIAGSMIGGVTMFAAVAWVLIQDRGAVLDPATATPFLYAWIALAFSCSLAALALWRVSIGPRIERARTATDPGAQAEALQSALVIVWALIEGPALFALVHYFLFATPLTLAAGLLLAWVGIGLAFPRAEWFARAAAAPARDSGL